MMVDFWNADNKDGTYTNPILYTDYSDPDAIRVGDDYYMVASSFSNVPGLPILHSKDLIHWTLINYVLNKLPDERYNKPVHGCGVWAPSIRYHEGLFYVCFPMPDEGIFMCTSKNPYDEWSEPVNIRPGAGWIDPCPFWDEDGRAYLVAGVAKSRIGYKSVLHIVEMQPDGMGLIGEEIKIFDGNLNDQHTIEGPKLYKRNGYYYIFAPAGGVKTGWQTVLRSKNIYGPYEYKVVMRQGDTQINGPHQGAWVDTPLGEDFFIHFQDVYCAGRIVHLQPMTWEEDWPLIGKKKGNYDYGEPVSVYKKPLANYVKEKDIIPYGTKNFVSSENKNFVSSETINDISSETDNNNSSVAVGINIGRELGRIKYDLDDDFSNGKLNLNWQWNANFKDSFYRIEDNSFFLNAMERTGAYGDAPNLLLQKWPAPEFVCTYKLDLSGLKEGDEAGVISFGMEYGLISFIKESDCFKLAKVFGKQHFEGNLVESTKEKKEYVDSFSLDMTTVFVRYMVERDGLQDLNESEKGFPKEKVTVSISFDDNEYRIIYEMTAVPGRWVGVKNGLFCFGEKAQGGFLKVHSVKYRHIYHNPVNRGFFPDPSVVRVGKDYYMVNSTFQYFPSIAISHSTDLCNWRLLGYAITDPSYLDLENIKDSHGIWAPDIEYVDGKFIIMATLRLNGDEGPLRRQLVVTSDKPEGPYSKPSWIEVDNIDPSLFVDTDGSKYMLISPGVNIIKLSDDCLSVVGEEKNIWKGTGERCPEGPHLFKRGDYYYAVLAEGGTGYGHGINVARSKNLTGPYEPSPYNPVLRQFDADAKLQRCGHGKFFEDHEGNWWVLYLCGRPNQGNYTTIGRETALEPVTWLEDGWFVVNGERGPSMTNQAPEFADRSSQSLFNEVFYEDFNEDKLPIEFLFVRNPDLNNFSLTERKGYLRIWTEEGTLSKIRAKNIILRRETELSYTAITKLDFNPKCSGPSAGLVCYYSTATYASLSLRYDKERMLVLSINKNHGEEVVCVTKGIKEGEIYLKVEVDKLTRYFSFSYDGINYKNAGELRNCVYLCDEGVPDDPKRHTGTLVGMYANSNERDVRIPADFDFFEYKTEQRS